MSRALGLAGVVFAGALAAAPAAAHPHAWIDVESALVFDAQGHVVGLRQRWVFDEAYTAFALEGLGRDPQGKPSQADLDALLRENMGNLAAFGYFTEVSNGGVRIGIAKVDAMSSSYVDHRIDMRFTARFDAPVAVAGAGLVYAVYDPTYFTEMLHVDRADAIALDGAPPGCRFALTRPEPAIEMIAFAAALDRTESAGDTLGAHFAERVAVTCP